MLCPPKVYWAPTPMSTRFLCSGEKKIMSGAIRQNWQNCTLYRPHSTVTCKSRRRRRCILGIIYSKYTINDNMTNLRLSLTFRLSDCLVHLNQALLFTIHQPDRQWRSSSFQESKKVRVSRDLWPWPWPWAHPGCTLTWSPSCANLLAIRPFACEKKRFAQKFRQTDRQTDRRRTPRHCISSFLNELTMISAT